MAIQKKLYTVEEFDQFADDSDRLLELIHGEVVEKLPTEAHGMVAAKYAARLLMFTEPRNLGRVGVEVRYRPEDDRHNSRLPDVSFNSDTASPIVTKGAVLHLPDLCIEIQSPNESLEDMRAKAAYYLANGARLVWLTLMRDRAVEVHKHGQPPQRIDIDGVLDGDAVLPGFTLPVRDIFPRE